MDTDEERVMMSLDARALNDLTEKIIGCAFHVSNTLGCGFLEKVYQNALEVALKRAGLFVEKEVRFKVMFEGVEVGEYIADLIVERTVIVETKTVRAFDEIHEAQCLNQLQATQLPICLLINFAKPRIDLRRIVGSTFPKQ